MNLFEFVKNLLKGNKVTKDLPAEYCPNCWGRQEYGGKFMDAVANEKIDLNNVVEKKGWIQGYAAKHLEGIKLQKAEDGFVCSKCKVKYR